jgi:hypothetical protein
MLQEVVKKIDEIEFMSLSHDQKFLDKYNKFYKIED